MKKWIALLGTGALLIAGFTQFVDNKTRFTDEKQYNYVHSQSERYMMAVLWQQHAGEVIALQYQAYNLAKEELTGLTKGKTKKQNSKYAVILDIDETILDNSPQNAWAIQNDIEHPAGWNEWVQKADAKMIAGAKDFLTYADHLGIQIFYITNRDNSQREATVANLQKNKLPQVNDEHLMLKTNTSSKEARRQVVASKYHVAMLIGDNLSDFSDDFYHKSVDVRNQIVHDKKDLFGTKYIVLPNPMYGDWEGALYNYNYGQSDQKKSDLRNNWLMPMK